MSAGISGKIKKGLIFPCYGEIRPSVFLIGHKFHMLDNNITMVVKYHYIYTIVLTSSPFQKVCKLKIILLLVSVFLILQRVVLPSKSGCANVCSEL